MKFLVLLILLSSCTKTIYSEKVKDEYYKSITLLWKKNGSYREVAAGYKDVRVGNSDVIFIFQGNCDSFKIERHTLISQKQNKFDISVFIVSRNGENQGKFLPHELSFLPILKRLTDFLSWCSSNLLSDAGSLKLRKVILSKKPSR